MIDDSFQHQNFVLHKLRENKLKNNTLGDENHHELKF